MKYFELYKRYVKMSILSTFILCSIQGYSQKIDLISFREIAIEQLKIYLKFEQKFNKCITINDTSNIQLHLPVLLLKEIPNDNWKYSALSPYLDKRFSPYNQNVIIKKLSKYYSLNIDTDKLRDRKRTAAEKEGIISLKRYSSPALISGNNSAKWDILPKEIVYYDTVVPFYQIIEYTKKNEQTILFFICGLPGVWGFTNDRLIKLEFSNKTVREIDGETYYREALFPLSPEGIKRVIEGDNFFVFSSGCKPPNKCIIKSYNNIVYQF